MVGAKIGYIRVSSIGQNTERQLEGVELAKTFTEKISAKSKDRPVLNDCLDYLREGDELHVHSIDRLARNLADLQHMIGDLQARDITVYFHKENLVFSGEENPMSKLMMQMMGAFAEFERNLIKERQAEGIAAAKKKGVRFGKAPKLTPDQVAEVKAMATEKYNKTEIAKKFGVSRQTIYNVLAQ
ncbi:recombinase family protein [Desulfogranum japonicum]|uniref:recombinase family protein n=1 Tax=Desulfogranum japonicum TaxID=231447 RepID=UPI0003FC58AA|nr:recombinase family protein [Desulfogranum japonicum]